MGDKWYYEGADYAESIYRIKGSKFSPPLFGFKDSNTLIRGSRREMEESTIVTVENQTASQESDFLEVLDPRL